MEARGAHLLHLKESLLLSSRGQERPKSKIMTQEIIKLSNALSWLLQGHRALTKKEEREIWDDTYGSIHSKTFKLYTLLGCRIFPYFPLQW